MITFRSPARSSRRWSHSGCPFYKPDWSPHVIGLVLGADTDWAEVTELLAESYCLMAPQKLARLVERPADPEPSGAADWWLVTPPVPGAFCLVLHSHLPWLPGHGVWPLGEEWLSRPGWSPTSRWSPSWTPLRQKAIGTS